MSRVRFDSVHSVWPDNIAISRLQQEVQRVYRERGGPSIDYVSNTGLEGGKVGAFKALSEHYAARKIPWAKQTSSFYSNSNETAFEEATYDVMTKALKQNPPAKQYDWTDASAVGFASSIAGSVRDVYDREALDEATLQGTSRGDGSQTTSGRSPVVNSTMNSFKPSRPPHSPETSLVSAPYGSQDSFMSPISPISTRFSEPSFPSLSIQDVPSRRNPTYGTASGFLSPLSGSVHSGRHFDQDSTVSSDGFRPQSCASPISPNSPSFSDQTSPVEPSHNSNWSNRQLSSPRYTSRRAAETRSTSFYPTSRADLQLNYQANQALDLGDLSEADQSYFGLSPVSHKGPSIGGPSGDSGGYSSYGGTSGGCSTEDYQRRNEEVNSILDSRPLTNEEMRSYFGTSDQAYGPDPSFSNSMVESRVRWGFGS